MKFIVHEWLKRGSPIALGGMGIYTLHYTSKYMFDRARELAELKLETEQDLAIWRERRRQGPVTVKLDNEYIDLASAVVEIGSSHTDS